MKYIVSIIILFISFSCNSYKAQPINLNYDNCDFCKMSIADGKYAAEVITQKGRVYKFDDFVCMVNYCNENATTEIEVYYVNDFTQKNNLILAEKAFFLSGGSIQSPMQGGVIAFSKERDAKEFESKLNAKAITWEAIITKK